jgi:uncharacterized protein
MASLKWTNRSLAGTVWDRLWGYFYKLPTEQNSYATTPISVPLSDGISLAADLYQPILPTGSSPVGTVFHFTPYGRNFMASTVTLLRPLAARGYQVLNVSARSGWGSKGAVPPTANKQQDVQDAANWMRKQEWYTGSFATIGVSYNAHNGWALMMEPPPDLAAAVSIVGPHDMSRFFWENGAPSLDIIPWTDLLLKIGEGDLLTPFYYMMTVQKRLRPVLNSVPLLPAIDKYFEGKAPWIRDQLTQSDLKDECWRFMQCGTALERTTVPTLIIGGWRDLFIVQALEQYSRLSERGVKVALTIGPWIHTEVSGPTQKDTYAWLEEHLAHRTENHRPKGLVQVCVSGAGHEKQGVWCHLPHWPPPTAPFEFYLHSAGKLATIASSTASESTSFTFNPAHPPPSGVGPFADNAFSDEVLEVREDVLTFITDPLGKDVEVLGAVTVELSHTSDNPHVDLYLRLSEVRNGKGRIVADRYKRLDPKRDSAELVQLTLHPCAHRFKKGGCIRILIAGGQYPRYMRNLGTDEISVLGTTMKEAKHTIHHDAKKISRVILPVGDITTKSEA